MVTKLGRIVRAFLLGERGFLKEGPLAGCFVFSARWSREEPPQTQFP